MITARMLATFARAMSGARPRWMGCRPDARQRVYFANHTSHMDAIVIWAVLPRELRRLTRPVAGRDYWESNRLRHHLAASEFNAVLIDRQRGDYHHNPIDDLVEALGDRHSLIFFPEGRRGTGDAVQPFQPGLYHLAQRRPDVELIPVYLTNLARVLPKGSGIPVPLQCDVIFGAPVALETGEEKRAFLERARQALEGLARP